MTPTDALDLARSLFERAPFMQHLGVEVCASTRDEVVIELALQPWMTQATGVAHAGIVTAIADHCAAAAARVRTGDPDGIFVSIQLDTQLVRPASGPRLRVVGRPINCGKRVAFAQAEVFNLREDDAQLCATFRVSLIEAKP